MKKKWRFEYLFNSSVVMAEQCTMQKYPLGLSNSPLPPTALHPPPFSPLAISQLFFCGFEDKFLITTLASGVSKPIVVWDLRRGAVQHDIPLFSPLGLAGHARHRLYLLLQNMRIPNWWCTYTISIRTRRVWWPRWRSDRAIRTFLRATTKPGFKAPLASSLSCHIQCSLW